LAFAAGLVVSGCNAQKPARDAQAVTPATQYTVMAPLEEYLADRDAEIALARSAAPSTISDEATILVFTRQGFETAVEGKNGFLCFVDRSWTSGFDDPEFWNPKKRGPQCLNQAAVRSAMPIIKKLTELALAGLSKDTILARIKESIAKKEFAPPEIGAMSYMMSKSQYLGDGGSPHWRPHLMFYMPGDMDGSTWGANLPAGSAVFGGGQDLPGGGRMPWTLFYVPVPVWSDGTPADTHHS
jgi:hypothetical protein